MSQQGTATFWSSPSEGKSTQILLIRHGRVAWNMTAAYTGWSDVPLDARGEAEAAMTSGRLANVKVDAVYASDLKRAVQTAELIAKPHGLSVITDQALREINYGEWEGLRVDEICKTYGEDTFQAWLADPENVRVPGGESIGDLRDRVVPAMANIIALHPGETVVVVGHGTANRVLLCIWLGLSAGRYKQFEQDNCAISSAVFRGNRTVVTTVNDVCHIAEP